MQLYCCSHSGRKIIKPEFFSLFVPCWNKAVTVQSIQARFWNTGVWPVNRSAITDEKMAPAIFFRIGCKIKCLWCLWWLGIFAYCTLVFSSSSLLHVPHNPFSHLWCLHVKLKNNLLQIFIFFYLTGNADKSLFVNPEDPGDVVLPEGVAGPTACTDPTGPSRHMAQHH